MRRAPLPLFLFLFGCAEPVGSLAVSVSGEDAAQEGFDASDFADGWSARFDALVVSLSDFDLRGSAGAQAGLATDPVLVDLTRGDAVAWTYAEVGARRWSDVRYRIRPATASSRDVGIVDAAIRQRMIDEGLSIFVDGTASRGGVERRFVFAFTLDVDHARCVGADDTDGIVVRAGAQNETQVTLHWDHLFFDSLVVDEASMRFDALAAIAADPITLEALSAQRLADLRDADGEPLRDGGGDPVVYDPGSTPLSEPTLRGMIEAAAVTIGHLDGEGHCEYTRH